LRSFLTRIVPELIRINISLSVTLSAFAAWMMVYGKFSILTIMTLAGIFLLACGASVINQIQEKERDAKMDRTKNRPLPSGKLFSVKALIIAIILLISGFGILAHELLWTCIIMGMVNILWYNGLYTWLKKKTAFAVVPGALSGVIPVFMGWSAAGGVVTDRPALLLAFFLFMWQIPHFWLIMLKYENEYRSAGFPVMTDIFTIRQFRNIILAWLIGATGMSLLLVFSGFWIFFLSKIGILGSNLMILTLLYYQLFSARNPRYRLMFITMNAFLLLVLGLIVLEKFIP
jgi:protoheme IX farnesyltransferase